MAPAASTKTTTVNIVHRNAHHSKVLYADRHQSYRPALTLRTGMGQTTSAPRFLPISPGVQEASNETARLAREALRVLSTPSVTAEDIADAARVIIAGLQAGRAGGQYEGEYDTVVVHGPKVAQYLQPLCAYVAQALCAHVNANTVPPPDATKLAQGTLRFIVKGVLRNPAAQVLSLEGQAITTLTPQQSGGELLIIHTQAAGTCELHLAGGVGASTDVCIFCAAADGATPQYTVDGWDSSVGGKLQHVQPVGTAHVEGASVAVGMEVDVVAHSVTLDAPGTVIGCTLSACCTGPSAVLRCGDTAGPGALAARALGGGGARVETSFAGLSGPDATVVADAGDGTAYVLCTGTIGAGCTVEAVGDTAATVETTAGSPVTAQNVGKIVESNVTVQGGVATLHAADAIEGSTLAVDASAAAEVRVGGSLLDSTLDVQALGGGGESSVRVGGVDASRGVVNISVASHSDSTLRFADANDNLVGVMITSDLGILTADVTSESGSSTIALGTLGLNAASSLLAVSTTGSPSITFADPPYTGAGTVTPSV